MKELIGTIYGIDRAGNYKIKSADWSKIVVLLHSSGGSLNIGDKVDFRIAFTGDGADFSRIYQKHFESQPKPSNSGTQNRISTESELQDSI